MFPAVHNPSECHLGSPGLKTIQVRLQMWPIKKRVEDYTGKVREGPKINGPESQNKDLPFIL